MAPLAAYAAVRKRESVPRWLLGALVIPAVALAIGLLSADSRHWQLQARTVFAAYTHRLPSGRLHDVYAISQVGRYVTICAKEGRDNPDKAPDDKRFCTEINLSQPKGHQVEGGYRYYADVIDSSLPEGAPPDPFDCFGDAIACIGK